MIGLQEAAWIAAVIGNGTAVIDKIYDRFFVEKTGNPPPKEYDPKSSALIQNEPDKSAIVLTKNGAERDKVTYKQLSERLTEQDLRYIKTREKVMDLVYQQWEAAYPTRATEMDPVRKVQIEQIIRQKTDELGIELRQILDFIQNTCKLSLDDHYLAFRDLTGQAGQP